MKRTSLLIVLIVLAVAGCKTHQPAVMPPSPVVLTNSDSVGTETIIKTEQVPVDVAVDLPQQSEKNVTPSDSSHVETDLASSDAWYAEGTLHHTIRNKPGQLKGTAFVPQTTKQTNKDAVRVKEVPVPEPYPVEVERELTRMEKFKLAAFWYLVGAVILSIGFFFRKPLFTALRKIIRL